jgi:hypothetical protein
MGGRGGGRSLAVGEAGVPSLRSIANGRGFDRAGMSGSLIANGKVSFLRHSKILKIAATDSFESGYNVYNQLLARATAQDAFVLLKNGL